MKSLKTIFSKTKSSSVTLEVASGRDQHQRTSIRFYRKIIQKERNERQMGKEEGEDDHIRQHKCMTESLVTDRIKRH